MYGSVTEGRSNGEKRIHNHLEENEMHKQNVQVQES